jgi:hypothetical protein
VAGRLTCPAKRSRGDHFFQGAWPCPANQSRRAGIGSADGDLHDEGGQAVTAPIELGEFAEIR